MTRTATPTPVSQELRRYVAKTTRVVLTCDLHGDGTEAVMTIRLDSGTARYELDLCQTHLGELT